MKAPSVLRTETPRDQMIELRRRLMRYKGELRVGVSVKIVRLVIAHIDRLIGKPDRLAFLSWAFGRQLMSSNDLLVTEAFGLVAWAEPERLEQGLWTFNPELSSVLSTWRVEVQGQLRLPAVEVEGS